jgi:hypothetical protein
VLYFIFVSVSLFLFISDFVSLLLCQSLSFCVTESLHYLRMHFFNLSHCFLVCLIFIFIFFVSLFFCVSISLCVQETSSLLVFFSDFVSLISVCPCLSLRTYVLQNPCLSLCLFLSICVSASSSLSVSSTHHFCSSSSLYAFYRFPFCVFAIYSPASCVAFPYLIFRPGPKTSSLKRERD